MLNPFNALKKDERIAELEAKRDKLEAEVLRTRTETARRCVQICNAVVVESQGVQGRGCAEAIRSEFNL